MKSQVLKYLGCASETDMDAQTDAMVEKALVEVAELSAFQYLYGHFDQPFDFMLKNEAYMAYLADAEEFVLCATTLGLELDRRLKRLQLEDMAYAVVFDAACSVYVERMADDYEKNLPFKHLGFRFCPGYAGTPLTDNKEIAHLLHAERIGISFLDSGLMLPLKSMTGIIRIGNDSDKITKTRTKTNSQTKNCNSCTVFPHCPFRLRGTTCYAIDN